MPGFFRRFRREKAEDVPEEDPESGEPTEEENLELAPEPMENEEIAEEVEAFEAPVAEEPVADASPQIPLDTSPSPPEMPPPDPPTPGSSPAPILTPDPGAPPPLPEADIVAAPPPTASRTPLVHCFLCGTAMEGSFCPKCRMIWRD